MQKIPNKVPRKNGTTVDRSVLTRAELTYWKRDDVREIAITIMDAIDWNGEPTRTFIRAHMEKGPLIEWIVARLAEDKVDGAYETLATGVEREEKEKAESVKVQTDSVAVAETKASQGDIVEDLRSILERVGVCGKAPIDEAKVNAIVVDAVAPLVDGILERLIAIEENRPKRIEVVTPQGETRDIGLVHKSYDRLLEYVKAGLATDKAGKPIAPSTARNIMLIGGAGAGKTTVCEQIATALGMEFGFNSAIDTKYDVLGFKDANSHYLPTQFYQFYSEEFNGGIYLWDELDASSGRAVLACNAALANGKCDFPIGMRNRHYRHIFLASCNTWNLPTADYNGRSKLDSAFWDRFGVKMAWDYDEKLERALAGNDKWSRFVQGARENVRKHGIKGKIISPRASEVGAHMLACGISWDTVVEDCLRQGLPTDAWKLVTEGL
jgi:hypothetical protein